jgi:hypothetical protein
MLGFDADGDPVMSTSTLAEIESAVVVTETITTGGAVTDASNVIYNYGAAGSVSRTIENRLKETISVKDFGAVGDGVTADDAAFAAAITYCKANDRQLYVSEPDTSYKLSSPLTIDCPFNAGVYKIWEETVSVTFENDAVAAVHPEWWGAKTDGTDITAAFNAASLSVNESAGLTGGGIILLGRGPYTAVGSLYLYPYQELRGVSKYGTRLYHSGNVTAITYNPAVVAGGAGGVVISGLRLTNTNGSRTAGHGVYLKGPGQLVEECRIAGFIDGVRLDATYTSVVRNVRSEVNQANGFSLVGHGTSVKWDSTYASYNTGNGYYVQDSNSYLTFINTASDNNLNGYYLYGTATLYQKSVTFTSPGAEHTTNAAILLRNTKAVTITGLLSTTSKTGVEISGGRQTSIIRPTLVLWTDYAINAITSPEGIQAADIEVHGPFWSSFGLGYISGDAATNVTIASKSHKKFQIGPDMTNMGTVLALDITSATFKNVAASETDMRVYTLPAYALNGDAGTYQEPQQYTGYSIRIFAAGYFAATADNKAVALYVDGTKVCDIASAARNSGSWMIEVTCMRVNSTAMRVISKQSGSDTTLTPTKTEYTDVTVDFTLPMDIKTTSTSTASDLVVQRMWNVELSN